MGRGITTLVLLLSYGALCFCSLVVLAPFAVVLCSLFPLFVALGSIFWELWRIKNWPNLGYLQGLNGNISASVGDIIVILCSIVGHQNNDPRAKKLESGKGLP